MKSIISTNLLKFIITTTLLTIVFRFFLSMSITNKAMVPLMLSALIYGLAMWFNGKYFGKKDYDELPIYDIGFRFHVATFVTHNLISILWFVAGLASVNESIQTNYIIVSSWAVGLVIHLFYYISTRRSAIKNLNKDDLFE